MKKFKQFLKDKKEKEDEDIPLIPSAIHFKHVNDKEGEEEELPLIPEPIHFKMIRKVKKKKLYEAKAVASAKPINTWLKKNDNARLGKTSAAVSKKLSADTKFQKEHKAPVSRYTADSSELNQHLLATKNKPKKSSHADHANGLDAVIDSNRSKRSHSLYSGVGFDPHKLAGKKGKIKSHAYISASSNKKIAFNFAHHKKIDDIKHVIHFRIKKNDPVTHIAKHSEFKHEHESIIKRGTTLVHHGYDDYEHKHPVLGHMIKTRVHHMSIES